MDPALEAAALRAISLVWESSNWVYLQRALRAPAFALGDGERTLGQWERATRTITLSRSLVFGRPWDEVVEVLKHEMAHQWAHEVLGAIDETAHGRAFVTGCRRLGVDPSASGPVRILDPDDPRRRAVERIHKLLALATSPNRNEAEAAMRAARRRMLEAHVEIAPGLALRPYTWRIVGAVRARFSAHERVLAGLLGEHFFVKPLWVRSFVAAEGRDGTALELSGTPEDLDVAEYVHGFLLATSERLWAEHKRAHRLRSDADRRRFLTGVMQGFGDKLRAERPAEVAAGLVWKGDPGLDDYVGRRHPRTRAIGVRISHDAGFDEGRRAGRSIVLHKGMTRQGNGGGLLSG